jgi:hypothetical protein
LAHLVEVPPYLAALWLGMAWYGLAGAAAAFAFRMLADDILLARFGNLGGELVRVFAIATPALALAVWLGEGIVSPAALLGGTSIAGAALLGLTAAAAGLWLKGEWSTLRKAFGADAVAQ